MDNQDKYNSWIDIKEEKPPIGEQVILYNKRTNGMYFGVNEGTYLRVNLGMRMFGTEYDRAVNVSHWRLSPCPPMSKGA